jgi:hypothetical protein
MRLEALEHKLGMALQPKSEDDDASGEKLAMDVRSVYQTLERFSLIFWTVLTHGMTPHPLNLLAQSPRTSLLRSPTLSTPLCCRHRSRLCVTSLTFQGQKLLTPGPRAQQSPQIARQASLIQASRHCLLYRHLTLSNEAFSRSMRHSAYLTCNCPVFYAM